MSFVDQSPPVGSVAGKVTKYTDLDVTPGTGEYYVGLLVPQFKGHDDLTTTLDSFDSFGSLSTLMDDWTSLALEDVCSKLVNLAGGQAADSLLVTREGLTHERFPLSMDALMGIKTPISYVTVNNNSRAYTAVPGQWNKIGDYADEDSIYKASLKTPVWILKNRDLYVYPLDTTYTYDVTYYTIPRWTVTAYDVLDENGNQAWDILPIWWENMASTEETNTRVVQIYKTPKAFAHTFMTPANELDWDIASNDLVNHGDFSQLKYHLKSEYVNAVALKVASLLIQYRLMKMKEIIPAQVDYKALNATHTVAADTSHGWERVRFYIEEEEDSELTQMLLGGLNAELQAIVMRYQWYTQQKALVDSLYNDIFMTANLQKKAESGQV